MEKAFIVVQEIGYDSYRTILAVFSNRNDAESVVKILESEQEKNQNSKSINEPLIEPLEIFYYVEERYYYTTLESFCTESAKNENKRIHDSWGK